MAVLLLARDGKLSLDDPVRKYIPELPDYGVPLTIRHMLNHTSGLRDWGSVAGIAGWPRTTREYTHAHVLEIVSRAEGAELPAGHAVVVQQHRLQPGRDHRVARQRHVVRRVLEAAHLRAARHDPHLLARRPHPHRQGPRDRLRERARRLPHRDAVRERARQRRAADDGRRPAEVERELRHARWSATRAVVAEQATAGHFNDGRELDYALGLFVGDYRGVHNVYHSGSTAGYRAHLNRFPAAHTSVAVLCNVSTGDATRAANTVSDLYLAGRLKPAAPATPPPHKLRP